MSRKNLKLTKKRVKSEKPPKPQRTNEAAKAEFDNCIRSLHKIKAVLVPVQYAALYDVPFDMSDALVTVIDMTDRLLLALDQLETVI